jgi:hypothetical protein
MSSLLAGTPIVLFCMDNSSFLAATEEGGLVPISKCVEEDNGYHVNGALVVAPERSIQFSIEQLRRIISEFSEYILYIITPVTRYISMPCCDIPEHVTNFRDPDFLSQILADLTKLKFSLRKKLSPAIILDGIELVCGAGCSKERVEQTLRAGWASNPVHPNAHIYAKMALNLLEKVSAASEVGKKPGMVRKRKRSESSNSSAAVTPQHQQTQQSQHNSGSQQGSRGSFRGPFEVGVEEEAGMQHPRTAVVVTTALVGEAASPAASRTAEVRPEEVVEGQVALREATSEASTGLDGRQQ